MTPLDVDSFFLFLDFDIAFLTFASLQMNFKSSYYRHLLGLAFMLLVFYVTMAQERRFLSLSTQDGLPQNSVECFAQDSSGYLWIGTQDGLVRYDGYEMLVFQNNQKDENSISDNFITRLFVDDAGGLWVGTRNGINFFDEAQKRFIKFLPDLNRHHQNGTGITQGAEHRVIITISGRSYRIDKTADWKVFNALNNRKDIELDGFKGLEALIQFEGKMLGVSDDVFRSCEGSACVDIPLNSPWPSLTKSEKRVVESEKGFWILANGLYFLSKTEGSLQPISFHGSEKVTYLNSISEMNKELWISTDKGVFILNKHRPHHVIAHCVSNPNDDFSLNYDFVHGLFKDREGRMWVGTANNGLNIYNPKWEKLRYMSHTDERSVIANPLVWCSLIDDDGRMWIGTASGISLSRQATNGLVEKLSIPKKLSGLESVRDLMKDKAGNVWIASSRSGLYQYDVGKSSLKHFPQVATEVVSIEQDDQGGIWVGSYNGLFYASAGSDDFRRLDKDLGFSPYTLSIKNEGAFMGVCHSQGYAQVFLNPDMHAVKTSAEVGSPTALPFSICSDAVTVGNETFVGMYDRGVAVLDEFLKLKRTIDESNGLLGHVVESMLIDDSGYLWIATNQGLSRYDPKTEKMDRMSVRSGLRNGEFTLGGARKGSNGLLYFGSVDGLLYFHPDSVFSHSSEIKNEIQLTNLEVNYQDYRAAQLEFSESPLPSIHDLSLGPDQRVITLVFSAMNFERAHEITYRYRLGGFDSDWVKTGFERRFSTYSNLPSGNYVFEVEALLPDGSMAGLPLKLTVHVLPPFYETWWFRLLAILFVFVTLISIVRYLAYRKYQRQLRELETKQSIQSERERISRDLHDNVGSQITYMISTLDNMAYKSSISGDKEGFSEIDGLGDFARGTMNQLREAIWVINKDAVTVEEFRMKLEDYCQRLLTNSTLNWSVELSGSKEVEIQPGTVLHLFRICQEAINNCLKHAHANAIHLKIDALETIVLTIKDDGIGFDTQKRKLGHYGLDNMTDRVKEMNASIVWKSEANQGTEIVIRL